MPDNYLITGCHGKPHVTAENDRGINAGIVGAGRFVLPVGEQFRVEKVGSNTIRMRNGKLLDNGAAAGIPVGEYIDFTFSHAAQGKRRNDLIVFQYIKYPSTQIESGTFVVVKGTETSGTPTDPDLTQEDLLLSNSVIDQMPLWRVTVSDFAVSAPVQLFSVSKNLEYLAELFSLPIQNAVDKYFEENPNSVVDVMREAAESGEFDGKSAYAYAQDGGYTGTEEDFAKRLANGEGDNYVTAYGAKGDGTTDDTAAFQAALAEERVVFVPGGTYKLTGGIVIGDNCMLELSQDTVLNFTNTSGNCITLGMASTLKGNHATVNVPYEFTGHVLHANSADHTSAETSGVPPFTRWDPMWKSGRYVTDINICKADSRGFHYSVNGECNGTAVYLSADATDGLLSYMWGVHFSGLRIAGAFSYGIHAENSNEGWLHEMRLDAFIDACEIGVCLEDCNNAYISAVIQPRRALKDDNVTYVPYAKHGIKLVRSKNADLSGSRVWDWNSTNSLWTNGGEYQHIAMIGECRGCIINSFQYYETSADIRDLIYTDTPSNLEQMTILQEPITRWFKPKDGAPYFYDGYTEKKLVTKEELDEHFITDSVPQFTDVLATAVDTDGKTVYNGIGYKMGCYVNGYDEIVESAYYGVTGFIPVKVGSKMYVSDLSWSVNDGYCRVNYYDANRNPLVYSTSNVTERADKIVAGSSNYLAYEETSKGFVCTVKEHTAVNNIAYVRMGFRDIGFGASPMIAIDEEIAYRAEGFLADGIKVKGESIIGLETEIDARLRELGLI